MNIKETTELLALISEAYVGRFPVASGTILIWQEMLSDQDFEGVMGRTKKHIATSPHPPAISDLKVTRYPVFGD